MSGPQHWQDWLLLFGNSWKPPRVHSSLVQFPHVPAGCFEKMDIMQGGPTTWPIQPVHPRFHPPKISGIPVGYTVHAILISTPTPLASSRQSFPTTVPGCLVHPQDDTRKCVRRWSRCLTDPAKSPGFVRYREGDKGDQQQSRPAQHPRS